ncbi:MAG: inositol phosphorylceramide synthase [Deltaproteobacteria bacterium]|nr:inositol phosphorylceramide synthase [Deltaproteobacteria bacterium]
MTSAASDDDSPDTSSGTSWSRWLWAHVFLIGPDLILLGLFVLLLAGLLAVYGGRFAFVRSSFLLPLLSVALLIVVATLTQASKVLTHAATSWAGLSTAVGKLVRDWLPLVLVLFVYENLHDLTYLIRPDHVDAVLLRIDELIFGVEPTILLQAVISPWLTEYMTFAYALYFVFPTFMLVLPYTKGQTYVFREGALALSLCCYLGFLGYITVPAVGPRYFIPESLTVPLTGIWLTARAAAVWNALETVQRDCFPSLHTAMSTIALVYLWRLRRYYQNGMWVLAVATPLTVSLWLSTVYLRYHWTVDVVAGWALAFLCVSLAPAIVRRYYKKKDGARVQVSPDIAREGVLGFPQSYR